MSFSSVTVRENGQRVDYSWWNSLRTAGAAVEAFLGAGFISETPFAIANGQASAANITGLAFSSAAYKGALITMEVRRKTDSSEVIDHGMWTARYKDSTSSWELLRVVGGGDETGVTLSITAGGQVQYTSDTLSGANYSGTFKFRAMTFNA